MSNMGLVCRSLILIAIVACLTSIAHAITGQATFYTPPYVPSSCYGYQGRGIMIVAANCGLFSNKGACGTRYRVRCTGEPTQAFHVHAEEIPLMLQLLIFVLDAQATNLTFRKKQEAFAMIADPNAGRINIEYDQI